MNKIGILTFQNTINFGADLQLYALYTTIKTMGETPIVIDYKNESVELREFPKFKDNKSPKKFVRYIVQKIMTREKVNKFGEFKKKTFKLSENNYSNQNFHNIKNEVDIIIVGSDQVWNTNLTGGDLNYFLPIDNVRKYSYAASFGIDNSSLLSDSIKIGQLLNDFTKI